MSNFGYNILNKSQDILIDPLARNLIKNVEWYQLENISNNNLDLYPVAEVGNGPTLLLLHGFDSSFLEFRRIVPLLKNDFRMIIPDLFGFGFCPRPKNIKYNSLSLMKHIKAVLKIVSKDSRVGIIGASMGGALALDIAKAIPKKITKVLLLSPAGLTGKPQKIPIPLNKLGVCFLSQSFVRKRLCRQAFAYPNKSVSVAEEEIASLHLKVDGWARSLAEFARSGGLAGTASPLPDLPVNVLWGENDRILSEKQKNECIEIFNDNFEEISDCGHLPHIDQPEEVFKKSVNFFNQ
tara:strand:+ start:1597 stop:2478 length:882 start_codon:yes stop_codon:yes gene_type:complete